jgi:hypothetical protein
MYGATNIQKKLQNFSGKVLGHLGIFQIVFFRKMALTAPQTCIYEHATCHMTLFGHGTGGDMGHFLHNGLLFSFSKIFMWLYLVVAGCDRAITQ